MLEKVLCKLSKKKSINTLAVVSFASFLIFLHDSFVKISVSAMNSLSRTRYNEFVLIVVLVLLGIFFIYFFRKSRELKRLTWFKWTWLYLTLFMIWLHTEILFVMNIEIIHSFQYGILALMIYPLVRSFGAAVFWTALIGAFDEWFQYVILYPEKNDYYDFNDVILNMLGTGFSMVILFNTRMPQLIPVAKQKLLRSSVLIMLVLVGFISMVLFKTGSWQLYAKSSETTPWLLFNKASSAGSFWRALPASDITFHVLSPLEGVVIFIGLLSFYYVLDFVELKFRN